MRIEEGRMRWSCPLVCGSAPRDSAAWAVMGRRRPSADNHHVKRKPMEVSIPGEHAHIHQMVRNECNLDRSGGPLCGVAGIGLMTMATWGGDTHAL